MFQKIKEYLASHPNSSLWYAVICSLTSMSGDEWVAFMSAFGILISTILGAVHRFIILYTNYKENKIQKDYERQVSLLKAQDESERYKVETQLLLAQIPLKQPILLNSTDNEDGN